MHYFARVLKECAVMIIFLRPGGVVGGAVNSHCKEFGPISITKELPHLLNHDIHCPK